MKRINVNDTDTSTTEYIRFFSKYAKKRGFDTPIEQLPMDILRELHSCAVMSYSARHLDIDEEFELDLNGMVFKCRKEGRYSIWFDKDSFSEQLQIDCDNDVFNSLINPINHKVLKKSELFTHPLTVVDEAEIGGEIQPCVNGYGVASMLINCIRNPEDTEDGGRTAEKSFATFILESGRFANVPVLLEKVKAGELSAMMEVSTIINDGFEITVARSLGKNI